MAKISIVCPNCKAKLALMEFAGWQEKTLKCPHCNFSAKASVFRLGTATQGARPSHDEDDVQTRLSAPAHTPSENELGVIVVKATGRRFILREGTNVIGREAKSGTADLMISTDPYMSRRHVQIDVVKTPAGYDHRLVEIDSKNIVELNGAPIKRGDILKLNDGDRLLLGETEVMLIIGDKI